MQCCVWRAKYFNTRRETFDKKRKNNEFLYSICQKGQSLVIHQTRITLHFVVREIVESNDRNDRNKEDKRKKKKKKKGLDIRQELALEGCIGNAQ